MRNSVKGLLAIVVLAGTCISTPALSETLGLLNGRSADVSRMTDRSVEVGAIFGDVRDGDYEHFGARFNYKVNPTMMAYGDLGNTDVEDADGLAFGLGAFFQMDGVLTGNDFAIHGSVHRVKLERDRFEDTVTSITVEALITGKEPIGASGSMFWNSSVGLNRISGDGDSDTELTFSGGVVLPNAAQSGEFYAGILYVDDMAFGAGYRHFLK